MPSRTPLPATAATFLLLALRSPAQLAGTDQLVGWTDASAAVATIDIQPAPGDCLPARRLCNALPGAAVFYAGGTAYDPRTQSAWVSDGQTIENVALAACASLCRFPAQRMRNDAVVSGLALDTASARLIQLETAPGYLGLRSYDTRQCPPIPLRDGCTLTLAAGAVAGGLALDVRRGLVWYSISAPTALDYVSDLAVADDSARCVPLCTIRLPRCGPFYPRAGVITGLAYDNCSDTLFATNGQWTQSVAIADPRSCRYQLGPCCNRGLAGEFRGLDVIPGFGQRAIGTSCSGSGCAACPAMVLATDGDAVPGNPAFAVTIGGAEVGAVGILVLGGDACTNGVRIPQLCGPFHPALAPLPIVLPPVVILGPGPGCGGQARVDLPIPLDPSLCGATLCAQWLVACRTARLPLGVTHAAELVLAGG